MFPLVFTLFVLLGTEFANIFIRSLTIVIDPIMEVFMKKNVLFILLAFSVAALASAQRGDWRGWGFPGQQPAAEQVTVSGALTLVQGSLAVKSGDTTYLVSGLRRYVGFIDSLKDGAQVKLEGSAVTSPQDAKIKMLRVSKLTIGGKDYDVARPQPQAPAQPTPGWPMMRMQQNWRR
jgi:hypothetical protein